MEYEKTPLASKKFVAFLVAEVTWKVVVLVTLVLGLKNCKIDLVLGGLMMAVVLIAGFVEAGYIIGQASLDRYTRIAEIATKAGKSFATKDITVGAHPAPQPGQPAAPPKRVAPGPGSQT